MGESPLASHTQASGVKEQGCQRHCFSKDQTLSERFKISAQSLTGLDISFTLPIPLTSGWGSVEKDRSQITILYIFPSHPICGELCLCNGLLRALGTSVVSWIPKAWGGNQGSPQGRSLWLLPSVNPPGGHPVVGGTSGVRPKPCSATLVLGFW